MREVFSMSSTASVVNSMGRWLGVVELDGSVSSSDALWPHGRRSRGTHDRNIVQHAEL